MSGRLAGRIALITGAASGIGRAAAELFASHGARTVLFGLGDPALDDAAAATSGIAVRGDVTSETDVAMAIASCGGRLDVVLNAAGLIVPDEPLTVTDEVWTLRRVAEPSEIASCCLFLACDEASFVTGAVLVADGGGRAPTQNRAV